MKVFSRFTATLALTLSLTLAMFAPTVSAGPNGVRITQIHKDFDETADPFADLETAMTLAQADNQVILLDVGGEWCSWCHLLDQFINTDEPTRDAFSYAFVVLKVNYSRDNPNTEFLSQYPEISGYPHFFVLDANGEFLLSQDTAELEEDGSYSSERLSGFANQWCDAA